MKRFFLITMIILFFYSPYPVNVACAATTESSTEKSGIKEMLGDAVSAVATGLGYVVDKAAQTTIIGSILADQTLGAGDYADYLPQYLKYDYSTHQVRIEPQLYALIVEAIKANASQQVNISDYIYKYYPDKDLSPNRVPAGTASYDYFVKTVGEAAKAEIKDVKNHKYYWMSFAGQGGWSNEYNAWYAAPRFAYIDSQYEDNVIWIHTDGAVMQPYTYDRDLQSFETVPLNISIYDYTKDDWGNILGESKPGEFYRGSAFWSGGNYNWNAIGNYARTGSKFWFCGFDNPEDTVDGYGYFGTIRFPIWVSQEKYIEYMSLYPNYDPTQTVTKNEDNSVTINNYYTTQEKEDQESKKTLEEINKNVKSMKSSWELFRTWIYGELDSIIVKLIAIDDHMEEQIDLLTSIVTNTSGGISGGGSASGDLSEVIDQLKKINNKLLYSNILDTINDVLNWVNEWKESQTAAAMTALQETMSSVFPFSVVTDLVLITQLFVAAPVVPTFTIPMDFTSINSKFYSEISIDFSQFEDCAKVLRAFLIIGWISFLIMVTNRFINKGGD